MTEIDIYGDEDVILLPSPHMAWDDDAKWKADSRLYNEETDAWVKKLARNRDREVTLSILISDMNDTFGTKAGRYQIKKWRTKAKEAYMAGERRRGIRPTEVVASNVVGHAKAPFTEADEGKLCKVRLQTRTSSTGRVTQTGWNQPYEAQIIRVNKNGTFDAFFPGRPITNRYAEFSSARKIPVIENNPSRHFELFEQYVHDEKHREKAREREKKKMEDELAVLRKTLAVYRYKFRNQQGDEPKTWKELQKIADDQYLYYDATKNEFDMYEQEQNLDMEEEDDDEFGLIDPSQVKDAGSSDGESSSGSDDEEDAAKSLSALGKRKKQEDRVRDDGTSEQPQAVEEEKNPYLGKRLLYTFGRKVKRRGRMSTVYDKYVGEVISVNDKGLYYAEFSTKNGKLVEDEDFQKIENVKEAKIKRFIKAYDKMAKKSKDMEPNEY
eukprot:g3117.t1